MTYRVRNIAIAIALALVAAIFTGFYVTGYKKNVQEAEELIPVYVATKDIPAGTPGSELQGKSLIGTEKVSRRNVAPGAISTPTQVKDTIAAQPVYAGEQITTRRFLPLAERGVRSQISGNMRALQVPGDEHQLLAGTLENGDHVDVVASLKFKLTDVGVGAARGETERLASRIVLRDLLVLQAPSSAELTGKLTSRADEGFSVLLAVTDRQAQKLFFVTKNGDWSLQLRPAGGAADSSESVETPESVLGDGLKRNQLRQLAYGRRAP